MNPIHIRDRLKTMRDAGIVSAKEFHQAYHAPLFSMPGERQPFTDDQIEWLKQNVLDADGIPTRIPFTTFIVSTADDDFYFWRYADIIKSVWAYRPPIGLSPEEWWVWANYHYGTPKIGPNDMAFGTRNNKVKCWFYRAGKPVDAKLLGFASADGKNTPLSIKEGAGAAANTALGCLTRICFDAMSGMSTVLRVEPDTSKCPRSVEWRLARTHYLLLHPKQAQACSKHGRGPTDEEIVRAAHWRKAHFRRLVAARFSEEMRSKLRPVRQAWVGPKEWIGLDRKIYKVVENL